VAHSLSAQPTSSSRVLGTVGILGGVVLLAAFLVDIGPDLNGFRIILFNLGAISIVVAVHRGQALVAPSLALLGAVPALLANAWYIAMVVLASGRSQPSAGDFGFVFFVAGIVLWLADAAFGLVALRLGVVWRWSALALAIGSALALTGIDRLGLTSTENPTIFGPLSLAGAALNGFGWILLGIEVATGRQPLKAQETASPEFGPGV